MPAGAARATLATFSGVILLAAVVVCVLLGGLAVFQLLLAAGRPLGRFAWGGRHDVLPRRLRIGSAVSVVVYAVIAAVVLQAAGEISLLPDAVADVGIRVVTGYFFLGVPLNAISRSRPERLVMTPVVLVLALGCLVVALG
jgi:predicted Co/Zn/Cd cation transporter (cation efflux family)